MTDLRSEWTCTTCSVRCYKMTGEPFPAPEGWDAATDRCVACARQDESPHDRARRELGEGKPPSRVMIKGISKSTMREMQQEMIESGDLDPSVVSGPSDRRKAETEEKLQVVKELLTADPTRTDGEVQREAGALQGTGKRAREELGLPSAVRCKRDRRDAEIGAAFEADRSLTVNALAERLGVAKGVISAARKRLGLPDARANNGRRPTTPA